jgi:hypothetical protein
MAAAAVLAATSAGCTPSRPPRPHLAHSSDVPSGYQITGFAPTTVLAWRTPTDKTEHVVALPHPTDRMRTLIADPKGGVWYVDYRSTGDVYGHASADSAVREYASPVRYLGTIAPAGEDAVWLTTAEKCEIFKVRPADGTVLARTQDKTDPGYRAECQRAEPFAGDGVVVSMRNRLAIVDTNGHTNTRELPAATFSQPADSIPPGTGAGSHARRRGLGGTRRHRSGHPPSFRCSGWRSCLSSRHGRT